MMLVHKAWIFNSRGCAAPIDGYQESLILHIHIDIDIAAQNNADHGR